MKKSVKITLIISVVLIIVGLIFSAIGFMCGASLSIYNEGIGFYVDSAVLVRDDNLSLPKFDAVDIDVEISHVEILPGSTYGIETVFYGESRKITYSIENGVLKVRGGGKRNIGISFGNFMNKFNTVKVYVPETELDKLNVKTSMGDVGITSLKVRELTCINNLGEVELEMVTAKNTDLQLKLGSLRVTDSRLGRASVDNDMGDFVGINITTDSLACDMNMGKVDVSGKLGGATNVDADMGEVKLLLSGNETDYDFDLKTNMGAVYLNGDNKGGSFKSRNGAANSVNVESDMGAVKITIE